ncbi:MAG: hypothetical protein HYX53_14525 [Chloroflexi bacterium]|nr:hypothetical protein [Chloroflexota bacterium]
MHPEWRAELRPLILGDEILGMPAAQARTDARIDDLAQAIRDLVAAQARTDASIQQLVAAQARTDSRLAELAVSVQALTTVAEALVSRANRAEGRAGNIERQLLELRYEKHYRNWFGKWLWPIAVVAVDEMGSADGCPSRRHRDTGRS